MKRTSRGLKYFYLLFSILFVSSFSSSAHISREVFNAGIENVLVDENIEITHKTQNIELSQGTIGFLSNYISTTGGPTDVFLTAASVNSTTSWLYVNGALLNELRFSSGSEITFEVRASGLPPGIYTSIVTVSSPGHGSAQLQINLRVSGDITTLASIIQVNFQDEATTPPAGWLKDYGLPYGAKSGSSYNYGWKKSSDRTPIDLSIGGTAPGNGRKRSEPSDILLATLMHMQGGDVAGYTGNVNEGIWEVAVPNGNYKVTVSVGDNDQIDSEHSINIEGISAISKFIPTSSNNNKFKSATITVSVSDGFLTLDAIGGTNTKINSVLVETSTESKPSVVTTNPYNNEENVATNASISTAIMNLPNGAVDNNTLSNATVFLEELPSNTKVSANVNGTGGGDAITLVPSLPLKSNTSYRFTITIGVKDVTGVAFVPFSMTFKTGSSSVVENSQIQFNKVKQTTTDNVKHTTLEIGPDGKLYATTIDGKIRRYPIADDGTLGIPEIFSLKDLYGNSEERAIIGLVFDPAATAQNLIIYITHTAFVFEKAPNFTSKITKLSGANLSSVQDIVINLPRSTKDHLTNSLRFGPDGAIYFTQGSNSSMGEADKTWDLRKENLLSAAVLRLDLAKVSSFPLDVLTSESGGTYNPYTTNAPLTIYASGVRNAYDLVWHSNGQLYVPTNGSGSGGNSPASVNGTLRPDGTTYNGPVIPALTNIQQVQPDLLFKVEKGGYYGHPNPLRGEYVMFGGNPTSANDPAQLNAYPVGTLPDANWKGFVFNFDLNKSANGAIEYKSNTFNGALKGKLLVTRFSQNKDIITLTPGGDNLNIISAIEGLSIPGFSGFVDPLDLIEDTRNGNIYISEYARNENTKGNITLLKPIEKSQIASVEKEVIFSSLKTETTAPKLGSIKNNGDKSVTITNLSFEGANNTTFEILNKPTLPIILAPAEILNLDIVFKPSGTVGPLQAFLNVYVDNSSVPDLNIGMYGLSANGFEGNDEPPLNDIVKTLGYNINVGGTTLTLSTQAALIGEEVYAQLFQKVGAGNVEIVPVARYSPA
ncbi:MAG: Ig-like domain-containing protein, partial [Bacteroidota bacterium]|nr:Ig-like domain-containing protein [Bacteroidota bacterium]